MVHRYLDKYLRAATTRAIYRRLRTTVGDAQRAIDLLAGIEYGNDPKAMGIDIIIDAY